MIPGTLLSYELSTRYTAAAAATAPAVTWLRDIPVPGTPWQRAMYVQVNDAATPSMTIKSIAAKYANTTDTSLKVFPPFAALVRPQRGAPPCTREILDHMLPVL